MMNIPEIFRNIVAGFVIVAGLGCVTTARSQVAVPEGHIVVDGDMVMPAWQFQAMTSGRAPEGMAPEAALSFLTWPNGVVRYEFASLCGPTSNCTNAPSSSCVSAANRALMQAAMAVLESTANIDFQQCPNNACFLQDGSYLYIRDSTNDTTANPDNSCSNSSANQSPVGWIEGAIRTMSIVSWNSQFTIIHELMHTVGVYHEHQRSDRNAFVTINCGNVMGGCNGGNVMTNFAIVGDAVSMGPYDFDSVMHYSQCAFTSATNCPTSGVTINVNQPWTTQWQNAIGQRTHLSTLDQLTLSWLYPPPEWRFVDCFYAGGNGSSNGSLPRPFTNMAAALASTPPGGTIWVLTNCTFPTGTYNNNVTIRTAPNVTATFGG